tara:strand:- start:81 stop:362 length:282 start_codon:yes stop_codon:yes gene_type:complete
MSWKSEQLLKFSLSVNVGEMRGLMDELELDSSNDELLEDFLDVMKDKLSSKSYNMDGLIYHSIEDIVEGRLGMYQKEDLKQEVLEQYEFRGVE